MAERDGMNALANTINKRIRDMSKTKTIVDFGHINEKTLALKTDSFAEAIPNGEYDVLVSAGEIKGGEKVLVNWVGAYVVVVGIINQEV